jgi:hypothetical protein
MAVTDAMVDAAMRKAIEAGLFPWRGSPEDMAIGREIMRSILQAASEVAEQESADGWMWSCFIPAASELAASQ